MFVSRNFQIFFVIISLSTVILAQTEIDKNESQSKFKVQLEQTLTDTTRLKLPENRALVYAKLGKLYWRIDEIRARKLFQQSIDELIKAQNEAKLDKKNFSRRSDLLVYGQTRQKILELIVYGDADLAFKFFLASRSTTVNEAFAAISNEPLLNTYNGVSSDKLIVQQENMLEQRLVALVADQNPDRAVSILRDTLRKNISYQTIELLKKLYKKDKEIADTVFKEIIQKLLVADFNKSSWEFQLAGQLLAESTQEIPIENVLKIETKSLHALAEKIADFLIQEADRNAEYSVTYMTPMLIKFLPERAEELKQKTVPPRRSSIDFFPQNKKATELLQSDASAEKLLSEADKFPPAFREQIYVAAINKIALAGEVDRAKEILIKNFPIQRRDEMIAALNWQLAYRAIEKGEFDQATTLIEQLPEVSRFDPLIHLAENMLVKSPKDNQKVVLILGKARNLISDTPSNLSEIYKTGQLAAIYSLIDTETGFGLLDQVIKKIAEVSEADVIVKNFRGDSNVQQGEFVINSGFLFAGFSEIQVSLSKLARTDFEKTIVIINKIQRRDVRIALQLEVLENAFN
jgi:hypothetical protein